ncbi:hypothetical protein HEP86_13840 [Streptomyces sp. RPA4-5]|uniref:toxin-antitoxin system YwqK family antitoxin n=1 Tax=unclassified Streptomyces TaxID=2593676 RepID=UPI00143E150B|nr:MULTISPECIES: hypothetical protein [unclassified Streptomyces]QIY55419.1 hypothetical protein HEP86_13840 [Streptomyces sp. RPA4-5]WJY38147.1 hypothetical protein QT196_13075 [Streptomyces sp. P9-2B-2]
MHIEEQDSYMDDHMRVYHEGELFTGEMTTRDTEGRVIGLANYAEGIQSGPQSQWYSDGSKKREGQAEGGVAVGEWRKWHPNGQLAEHYVFDEKGRWVRRQRWDKEGKLTVDKSYTA